MSKFNTVWLYSGGGSLGEACTVINPVLVDSPLNGTVYEIQGQTYQKYTMVINGIEQQVLVRPDDGIPTSRNPTNQPRSTRGR